MTDQLAPFTAAGQGVSAPVAVLAAGLLFQLRDRFGLSRAGGTGGAGAVGRPPWPSAFIVCGASSSPFHLFFCLFHDLYGSSA
ncbi:hypothetical protein [Streptomyces sp. KMM 9044]|uniref:hypothetical protein n=1 Tax=Streptomyces sp. KMM 9044 TaxID=2744474 RepID=UPI0022B24DAA|nr:hypothetical protein [Streptomyces sp. KMM 9044]WAX79285.1 hypothetical protein HUV60_018085 [Streptomyces sp. KMM 9044]